MQQILSVLVLNIIFSFSIAGISWQAHIGGLIVDAAATAAMVFGPPERRKQLQIGASVGLLVLCAAIIGIRGARVKFSAMERIEKEETDWKDRRPTDEFWMNLVDIVDTLSGRPKACRTLPGSPNLAGVPQDHTPMPSVHGSPVMQGSKTPEYPNTGEGRRESLQLPPVMANGSMR